MTSKHLESFRSRKAGLRRLKLFSGLSQRKADNMLEDFLGEGYSPEAEQIAEWSGIYVETGNAIFSHNGKNTNGGVVWQKKENDFEIKALFSGQKGVGTFLLAKAIQENLKPCQSLSIVATQNSKGFYESLGMVYIAKKANKCSLMRMSNNDALSFANQILKEIES